MVALILLREHVENSFPCDAFCVQYNVIPITIGIIMNKLKLSFDAPV